jgi:hypothetical protein
MSLVIPPDTYYAFILFFSLVIEGVFGNDGI